MSTELTPECVGSQTVGPYYSIGLGYMVSESAAGPTAAGTHVTISGTLFDGDGSPIPDAIIEVWQANSEAHFPAVTPSPNNLAPSAVGGFARLSTHRDGRFVLKTVRPGAVMFPDGRMQAPHIVVLVFMRGILRHLVTRLYFPSEPANAKDPVLLLIPESRRFTLIAHAEDNDPAMLRWDIHLQGINETVFFDC